MSKSTQLNTAIGNDQLCAWQPEQGVIWIQTRSPEYARKLDQRSDSRLEAKGVQGGYLKTYEFQNSLSWARGLIERYTKCEEATGRPLIALEASRTSRSTAKV